MILLKFPCEFESSENGILDTNSVGPCESLTIEKPAKWKNFKSNPQVQFLTNFKSSRRANSQVFESSVVIPKFDDWCEFDWCSVFDFRVFSLFSLFKIFFFCSIFDEIGTHLKIFIVVSPMLTHFFSLCKICKQERNFSYVWGETSLFCYQCLTLSTASITRFMSSLARLRVSARTDLDIFTAATNLLKFPFYTIMPQLHKSYSKHL